MRCWGALLGLSLATACGPGCLAQTTEQTHEDEFTTDRPDFTETPYVMRAGVAQLESGFVLERSDRAGERRHVLTFPSSLLRIGIGRRMELRVGGYGYIWQPRSGSAEGVSGASDHEVQLKGVVLYETKRLPALSLIGGISFPIGNDAITSGGYDPLVKIAWAKELRGGFGLGGNINFASVTDEGDRVFHRGWSASLSHGFGRGFEGYWEFYGLSAEETDGRGRTVANMGMTHLVGKNVQIDVEAGRAVANAEAGWFVGFGLAIRHDFGRRVTQRAARARPGVRYSR